MGEAVRGAFRSLPLLLGLVALPSAALGHRLDECLLATIVEVEPSGVRLRINLTPGAAVAEPVVALVDRDGDGAISSGEVAAYAEAVRHDLTVRVDGRELEFKPMACESASPGELRTGTGIIRIEFGAKTSPFAAGAHRIEFENRHLAPVSVYLFNAARPGAGSVRVVRQTRNETQSVGGIEFDVERPAGPARAVGVAASLVVVLGAVSAGVWRLWKGPAAA